MGVGLGWSHPFRKVREKDGAPASLLSLVVLVIPDGLRARAFNCGQILLGLEEIMDCFSAVQFPA